MAHRALALRGTAAELSPAMEGLLPAIASTFQLILGHLWCALLVISDSLSQGPGLPAFHWEVLICTVVVALIVKTGHIFRRGKSPGERCSAFGEVIGECGENTGPENRAVEALQCPRVEASPLPLQTLCLAAMNTILSTSALQDTVDLLEKALKSLPVKVSKATDEEEHQERARWLQQQKQIEEELAGEILSLQTEEATLQHENTKLEGEIQQLKLKLQNLHELHDEEVVPLYIKFFEEERVCSELKKKLLNVCWEMNSTYQLRNLYKKMAEDLAQEVKTCTSYYHKENLFQMQRAKESWRAAVLAERKLEELRRQNEHNRQRLAMLEASFQPLPRGNFPPAAPPTVPRGPEVWGIPWAGRTPPGRRMALP